MSDSIWVICDSDGYDNEHILQLICKASKLSTYTNEVVTFICIGTKNQKAMEKLFRYGCAKVIFAECESDDVRIRANILKKMVYSNKPSLMLFPATKPGKYMASVLSTEFNSGLTADCIDVSLNGENEYIFSRAALNASVIAKIKCVNSEINMCTVKRNVFKVEECDSVPDINIECFEYEQLTDNLFTSRVELIKRELYKKVENNDCQSAKVVFAIGRGVGGMDNVEMIKSLAYRCGATVVGTKAAVDEGYIDKLRQVGQSGISIAPNVYVGFGVSGASQHIVGIKNANIIVAINKDENAPIFDYADYIIIDDVKTILEEMNKVI